jgi:hypothetical protein
MSGEGWDHFSDEGLADLVNGAVGEKAQAHLDACAPCRSRLEEIREAWRQAAAASMPEPSPLYWQAFPRQVRRGLEAHDRRRRRAILVPTLAAAAALALALGLREREPPPTAPPAAPLPAWTPLPEVEVDLGWLAVEGLLRRSEDLGPAASCRDIGECLASLSDEESEALARVLRQDLEGEEP